MTSFNEERFLRHINDTDKDLRLMALYDLRQHLKMGRDSRLEEVVIENVLSCLSHNERDVEVQSEAAIVLSEIVIKCPNRWLVLGQLLSYVTIHCSSPESEFQDQVFLSNQALRSSVVSFSTEAQRNIVFWQRELGTARRLFQGCLQLLESPERVSSVTETTYSVLNSLLPVFGEAFEEKKQLLSRAFTDFQDAPLLRRSCFLCIASLFPLVDSFTQEKILRESLDALSANTLTDSYVIYLQLCEVELSKQQFPSDKMICEAVESVCSQLQFYLKNSNEGKSGGAELLLEVLNSLLCLKKLRSEVVEQVVPLLVELASFDSSSCEVEEAADDYEDEYYDNYYGDVVDTTWKTREWAVRVIGTVLETYHYENVCAQAMEVAERALQDRTQLVRLEAAKLVGAAAPMLSSGVSVTVTKLVASVCLHLCNFIIADEVEATAALKSFQVVLGSAVDLDVVVPKVISRLGALQREDPSACKQNAYYIEFCRAILEPLSQGDINTEAFRSVTEWAHHLPGLSYDARSVASTAGELTRLSTALAKVFTHTKSMTLANTLVCNYLNIVTDSGANVTCRAAAIASLASWMAACGATLENIDKLIGVIWSCLEVPELQISALRAVRTIARSTSSASFIPPDAISTLAKYLALGISPTFSAVIDALSSILDSSYDTGDPQKLMGVVSRAFNGNSPLNLHHCALSEVKTTTTLLKSMYSKLCNGSAPSEFYQQFISPVWENVEKQASSAFWSGDALKTALEGMTTLIGTVYQNDEASRASIEEDTLRFLTSTQAHIRQTCPVVSCVRGSPVEVYGFLDQLALVMTEDWKLFLYLSELGRWCPVENRWCARLLESVQHNTDEHVRSFGGKALTNCMLLPQNFASILMPCVVRATDKQVATQYYYMEAIKEAATAALLESGTAFHDPMKCQAILQQLFLSPDMGDVMELYGACIGIVSAFTFEPNSNSRIAQYLMDGDSYKDHRISCVVGLRYLLKSLTQLKKDVSPLRPVVVNALLSIKRVAVDGQSTSRTLPLREMLLQLFSSVLQLHPEWLLCEEMRDTGFQQFLIEMQNDNTLTGAFELSGYIHHVDKGLECRKLAFEVLSKILWLKSQRGYNLIDYCNQHTTVVDALINACSDFNGGDRNDTINDLAKDLIVRFVASYPSYIFSTEQLDLLIVRLSHHMKGSSSSSEGHKSTLLHTIHCVRKLGGYPTFAHYPNFEELAEKARNSPLLAQSLKI